MGEYAKGYADGQEVKIGVCNEMIYMRYDQLKDVEYKYNCDDVFWRIPWPEEDGTLPGDYNCQLVRTPHIPWQLQIDTENLEKFPLLRNAGQYQMTDERTGLQMAIKCLHGLDLPKDSESVRFYWNGRSPALYLSHLNNAPMELKVCVSCHCCQKIWSFSWNEIGHLISSIWMRLRLFHQCNEYWFALNPSMAGKEYSYSDDRPCSCVYEFGTSGRFVRIVSDGSDNYRLEDDRKVYAEGCWEYVRNEFIIRFCKESEGHDMAVRYGLLDENGNFKPNDKR